MNEQQLNDEYDNLRRTRRGLFIDPVASEDHVEEIRERIDYICNCSMSVNISDKRSA